MNPLILFETNTDPEKNFILFADAYYFLLQEENRQGIANHRPGSLQFLCNTGPMDYCLCSRDLKGVINDMKKRFKNPIKETPFEYPWKFGGVSFKKQDKEL